MLWRINSILIPCPAADDGWSLSRSAAGCPGAAPPKDGSRRTSGELSGHSHDPPPGAAALDGTFHAWLPFKVAWSPVEYQARNFEPDMLHRQG
jgi:hypothetical protein